MLDRLRLTDFVMIMQTDVRTNTITRNQLVSSVSKFIKLPCVAVIVSNISTMAAMGIYHSANFLHARKTGSGRKARIKKNGASPIERVNIGPTMKSSLFKQVRSLST